MTDLATARRSLLHLLAGRALGVGLGLFMLALLWRRVPATDLGHFLTLLALLEMLVLVAGLGLSTVIQHHLPQWRVRHLQPNHERAPARLNVRGMALMLVALRVALALALAMAMALLWSFVRGALQLPGDAVSASLFLLWVGAGSASRCIEEIQASLMMQDAVQLLAVGGQLLRVAMLLTLPPLTGEPGLRTESAVTWLVLLDLMVCGAAAALGLGLLMRQLAVGGNDPMKGARDTPFRSSSESGSGTASGMTPGAVSQAVSQAMTELRPAWRLGLRFWWIQILGLSFGSPGMRLVVSHLGGPVAVAVLSAAQAAADAVRNALPITVLVGWLRPAMLRLHLQEVACRHQSPQVQGGEPDAAWALAVGVLQISALMLSPWLCVSLINGDSWLQWLAGSSWSTQAQAMSLPSVLMPTLLVLALMQSAHLALSLQSVTRAQPAAALRATGWAACTALPVTLGLWPELNILAAVWGMVVAEAVWVGVTATGLKLSAPGHPLLRTVALHALILFGAGAVVLATQSVLGSSGFFEGNTGLGWWPVDRSAPFGARTDSGQGMQRLQLTLLLAVASMATLWAALFLRPLSGPELQALAAHLPDGLRRGWLRHAWGVRR